MRQRLANRRACATFDFEWNGLHDRIARTKGAPDLILGGTMRAGLCFKVETKGAGLCFKVEMTVSLLSSLCFYLLFFLASSS